MDGVLDLRIAEERRDELARSVGFVPAGESARNEDRLGPGDRVRRPIDRLGRILRGLIIDHENFRNGAGSCDGLRAVILAVRSRKHRNENPRMGRPLPRFDETSCLVLDLFDPARPLRNIARIDRFQFCFVCIQQRFQRKLCPGIPDESVRRRHP